MYIKQYFKAHYLHIFLNYIKKLTWLKAFSNNLTDIEVNSCTSLTNLYCQDNPLESLNIKNGNNEKLEYFKSFLNGRLGCIQVVNPNSVGTNWRKDVMPNYT